jgi:hypothetical protein
MGKHKPHNGLGLKSVFHAKILVGFQKCEDFHFTTVTCYRLGWTARRRELQIITANQQYRLPTLRKKREGWGTLNVRVDSGWPPAPNHSDYGPLLRK